MTMISSAGTQPAISVQSGGWVRWIGRGAVALAGYLERRAAIRALLERDDRELRDIGLVRSQIEAAVGGAFNPDMGRMRKPL
ncbi:DUF1127 domain-containing protein [Bradyrhizobium sp.]|uniref:DUF1127 domain-containing protein n=1 Tax=Bradyrhizobium sp. TaxID=376 RepID=UPI00271ACD4A|nr:DUF1127 domain-containing protein [Bradyrhizobium sp.]MDO9294855.1 DUF1127 domain-containing protein [Bradyrhizobium sp.]